jgi:uncharacterized protein YjbI with pentapeptide repeats
VPGSKNARHVLPRRILGDHLRAAEGSRSKGCLSPRFWPDIRINLAGAALIDFNLDNGVVADASFHGVTFSGDASFEGATFSGNAGFTSTTFNGVAWFGGMTIFDGRASFIEAKFKGNAGFDGATFNGAAWFGGTFDGDAGFNRATFNNIVKFLSTTTFNGGEGSISSRGHAS